MINRIVRYFQQRKLEKTYLAKLEARIKQYAMRTRYEAAQTTDLNANHWTLADGYSPIQSLTPEVRRKIRQRARYEARENNSYANGMCNTLVDETMGRGPTIIFPDLSLEQSKQIQRAWKQWVTDNNIIHKVRSLVLSEVIEGEGLGILSTWEDSPNPVKLSLDVIECDYLEPRYLDSNTYPDGIDHDEFGRPKRYHLLDNHPGSGNWTGEGSWYDAKNIIHVFRQERAGQVRGVSRLAPCLTLFALLRRFTMATVEAAETAASFAAVLYSDPVPGAAETLGEDDWFDAIPMIHRALMTLPRGWKATQMRPEHPASTYAEFKRELMNEIGRCMGMPLNIALANSSGYNYSSGKLDHLTFYRGLTSEQDRHEITIWDRLFTLWYQEAWLLGQDIVPKKVKPKTIEWAWAWDRSRYADPLKEAMADKEKLASCMMSYATYYALHGKNWEEEFSQIAKERKFLLDNEISPDIIPPPMPEPIPGEGGESSPPPKKKAKASYFSDKYEWDEDEE